MISDEEENLKCFEHRKNVCELTRFNARLDLLNDILSFLNDLEMKEADLKEVITEADFHEEIRKWLQKNFEVEAVDGKGGWIAMASLVDIAEHFFELGLNTLHRR